MSGLGGETPPPSLRPTTRTNIRELGNSTVITITRLLQDTTGLSVGDEVAMYASEDDGGKSIYVTRAGNPRYEHDEPLCVRVVYELGRSAMAVTLPPDGLDWLGIETHDEPVFVETADGRMNIRRW